MRKLVAVTGAVLALSAATPAQAQPGGCLKYGLGGAIIGHFAGGHRLKGAALGCALGVIRRRSESRAQYNERLRQEELRQRRRYDEDAIARRRGRDDDEDVLARRPRRNDDEDVLARRPRRNDDEAVARRPNREFDTDETGSFLRPRRERDPVY